MTNLTKECRLCHEILPLDQFYKRKDRNGNYTWKTSYCKSCCIYSKNKYQQLNKEKFKKGKNKYKRKYYKENPDKVKITQKRYYYSKLLPDKQKNYKMKIQQNFPDLFNQIFNIDI